MNTEASAISIRPQNARAIEVNHGLRRDGLRKRPWKTSPTVRVSATAVTRTGMSDWMPWGARTQRIRRGP